MLEPFHRCIYYVKSVFLSFLRKVEINHSCLQPGMSQISLDDSDIDSGFQEMSGI